MWWALITVIVGLHANLLTVIVFYSMRKVSSNVYLMVLGASDFMFLVAFVFNDIFTQLHCMYFPDVALDIVNRSNVICSFLQYLLDLFSDFSALLILAFTFDRYIACYYPMRYSDLCTVRRSKVICIGTVLTLAVLIAPYHFTCIGFPHDESGREVKLCTIIPGTRENIFFYCYLIEITCCRIVPILTIAVCNVYIIRKVRQFHRARTQRRNRTICHQNKSENGLLPRAQQQQKTDENQHTQLTIMLIAVSTTYIVLYTPVLVMFFIEKFSETHTEHFMAMKHYTTALDVVGFAINFFLYTMGGKEFRAQLSKTVCSGVRRCVSAHPADAPPTDRGQFKRIEASRTVDGATLETHL